MSRFRNARQMTKHLRGGKEGDRVRNIVSGKTATLTQDVNLDFPFIQVTYRNRTGKTKGVKFNNSWNAENTRLIKKK